VATMTGDVFDAVEPYPSLAQEGTQGRRLLQQVDVFNVSTAFTDQVRWHGCLHSSTARLVAVPHLMYRCAPSYAVVAWGTACDRAPAVLRLCWSSMRRCLCWPWSCILG